MRTAPAFTFIACILKLFVLQSFVLSPAMAVMPTNPVTDKEFMRLPSGQSLESLSVRGSRLRLATGTGEDFTPSAQAEYVRLKTATLQDPTHPVQWALMDLDAGRIIDQSLQAARPVFGASVTKVFTGGAILSKQNDKLSSSQLQELLDMLVVSDNKTWQSLQRQVGDGDMNKGRAGIHAFTQGLGYSRTRGFSGYLEGLHGNELTALELVKYMLDTYKGRFAGAETLWKVMHTCRTGARRGRRYLPSDIFVGGKTGTYDGETENPETGSTKNPDGSPYKVRVRNHLLVFHAQGRQYAIAILANTGADQSAALLAGGLFREHVRPN